MSKLTRELVHDKLAFVTLADLMVAGAAGSLAGAVPAVVGAKMDSDLSPLAAAGIGSGLAGVGMAGKSMYNLRKYFPSEFTMLKVAKGSLTPGIVGGALAFPLAYASAKYIDKKRREEKENRPWYQKIMD